MYKLLAAVIGTLMISSAQAAISLSTPAAALGSGSVPGLTGTFWSVGAFLPTIAANDAGIVGLSPAATFRLTTPSTAYNLNSTLTNFLAGAGTVLTGNGAAPITQSYSIIDGFISIGTPGLRTFSLGSDDGSQLFVGGQLAVNNDGNHPLIPATDTVDFQAAGLYAIRLKFFENTGATALQLQWDEAGGFATVPSGLLFSSVPTNTSVVPLPAAGWLLMGGVALIGGFARRRKG